MGINHNGTVYLFRKNVLTSTVTGFGLGAIGGVMTHNPSLNLSWLDELTQGTLVEFTTWFTSYTIEGASNYIKSLK